MKKIVCAFIIGMVMPCLQLSFVDCQLSNVNAANIGTWKAYMAYHDVKEIEKVDDILYVLASDGLYTYNQNDNSIQTFDKTNGLSDCAIDHIAWNKAAKRLVIVYKNGNIDLMDDRGKVSNLSDYYTKSMTADKTIYGIDMDGQYAYIATGFGLMKLNVKDENISDTYNLGFRVDYSYMEGNYIFAASPSEGTYRGLTTNNLLDKNNWERVGGYTGRSKTIDPDLLETVKTLLPGGPKYNAFGFMRLINNKLYTTGLYSNPGCIQVLKEDGEWEVFQDKEVQEKTGIQYQNIYCVDVDPLDERHVFAGGMSGLFEFYDGKFVELYNYRNSPIEPTFEYDYKDQTPGLDYEIVFGVKYDPHGNLWFLNTYAVDQSIIKYTKNKIFESYDKKEFKTLSLDKSVWVETVPAHQEGDKWVEEIPADWDKKTYMVTCPNLMEMRLDSKDNMWFVNNHWGYQAFYRYDYKNDVLTEYSSFINQDGKKLDTTTGLWAIKCIMEDFDGNIWVGTNIGPLLLEKSQIDEEKPVYTQVKIPRNDGTNYADYLLSGVDITAIAIDGGGRKWFGTNGNGVYLISEDNLTQIEHFTTENSDLLSNTILAMEINKETGEVFVGTDKGLCSYVTDAVTPSESMDKDNVWAYPNPVRPDYTGPITITGLTYNADVKIVTTNGVLIAKGRSNGGLFVWDGNDLNGKRVASGVYMVETATQTGGKGTVCKIAIIN